MPISLSIKVGRGVMMNTHTLPTFGHGILNTTYTSNLTNSSNF